MDNKYLYQGDYSEFDEEIGWNDFELRSYDPQIGRWVQQDPYDQFASGYVGMGNNPINGVDANGGLFGWDDALVSGAGFATGYVSSGIQSGDWGKKSLLNGLANAGTFELSYLTSGGGLKNGSIEKALGFLGSSALGMTGADLPTYSLKLGDFTLTAGPDMSSSGVGFSFSASYRDKHVKAGVNFSAGIRFGTNDLSGFFKKDSRGYYYSMGGSIGSGNYSLGYSSLTRGGGLSDQRIGIITGEINRWTVRLDEDYIGDKEDRYFTGGGTLTYKVNDDLSLAFGLGMITGIGNRSAVFPHKPRDIYDPAYETPTTYRGGALYGGIIYKGKAYFGGINSEGVLHTVQNLIHRIFVNTPYFPNMGYRSQPWTYFGNYNKYGLVY